MAQAWPQTTEPWSRPIRAWSVALLLMVANTLSFVDRRILSLLVEPIKTDLAISDTQVSLLYGLSFTLFYIAVGVPIAFVADRSNRRNIVAASVLVWSVATTLCGFARSFGGLFAARIGVGAGEGGLTPSAYSILSDLFPRDRLASAMGVFQAGTYVGNATALILGGFAITALPPLSLVVLPIIGATKGWHVLFLALGLPGVVLSLVLLLAVKEPARRGAPAGDGGSSLPEFLAHVRRNGVAYGGIMFGFALMILVGNGSQFWIPAMIQRKFGWSIGEVGQIFGAISIVCGGSGVLAGGWFASLLRRKREAGGNLGAAMIGFVALVPITIAYPLMTSAWATFAVIGLMNFFAGFNFGGGLAALQEITPNRMRAKVSALYMITINLVGAMAGPTLIGWLSDSFFHDPLKLPQAIALVCTVASPLAVVFLLIGTRSYVRSLQTATLVEA